MSEESVKQLQRAIAKRNEELAELRERTGRAEAVAAKWYSIAEELAETLRECDGNRWLIANALGAFAAAERPITTLTSTGDAE